MPNRIIREGILTSDRIEQLDAPAEVFYRRLMSKVDDHGLYDARPSILRSSLYPLRVDRVREADIARWIAACEKAGVIALYQHDGKPYLQMLDTRWQARSEAKYPLPSAGEPVKPVSPANTCAQVQTGEHLDGVGDGDVVDKPPLPPKGDGGRFEKFWKAYPRKTGIDAARKAFEKRNVDDVMLARMLAAIGVQKDSPTWTKDKGQFIPHPSTWLNQGRWMDGADGDGSGDTTEWHETLGGVNAKAKELDIEPWDGIENFVFFKARVVQAAKAAA